MACFLELCQASLHSAWPTLILARIDGIRDNLTIANGRKMKTSGCPRKAK